MVDHSEKNFPNPTLETEIYWQGCRDHKLLVQQCASCGNVQFYPRVMCTNCISKDVEWIKASGAGKIKSFTIIHRAISKAYLEEVPYVVALIELEEGPTIMSNIIDCEPKSLVIGMDVEVTFENWSEAISIPKFRAKY